MDEKIKDYIEAALKAGMTAKGDIALVATIARLLEKDPIEVQTAYMDINFQIQAAFRSMMGISGA